MTRGGVIASVRDVTAAETVDNVHNEVAYDCSAANWEIRRIVVTPRSASPATLTMAPALIHSVFVIIAIIIVIIISIIGVAWIIAACVFNIISYPGSL